MAQLANVTAADNSIFREYRVAIEDRVVVFSIPNGMIEGDSKIRREVKFFDPSMAFSIRKWNGNALEVPVGSLYSGARGSWKEWKYAINISGVLLTSGALSGNTRENIDVFTKVFDFKDRASDGTMVALVSRFYATRVGGREVVILDSSERRKTKMVALDAKRSILIRPFRKYCVPVTDRLIMCFEVSFDGEKVLDRDVSEGLSIAEEIVCSVRIEPIGL